MLNRDTVLGFTTTLKFIPIFTHTSLTVGTDHHISSHHQYRAFIQMKQNKADPYKKQQQHKFLVHKSIHIYYCIFLEIVYTQTHTETHTHTHTHTLVSIT